MSQKLHNPHLINEIGSQILKKCNGNTSIANIVKELFGKYPDIPSYQIIADVLRMFQELEEKGILFASRKKYEASCKPIEPEPFSGLYCEITSRCNLKCKHCYVNGKPTGNEELPLDIILNILEQCKQLGGNLVMLSGGEPLLYPSFISICEEALKLGNDVIILTNGTLIDSHIISLLENWPKLRIQISLNGITQETHDILCGIGTFKLTMRGLKKCLDAGLANKLIMSFTVLSGNFHDVEPYIKWCVQNNIKKVSLKRLSRQGRARKHWEKLTLSDKPEEISSFFYEKLDKLLAPYKDDIHIDGIPSEKTFSLEEMVSLEYPCPLGSILRIDPSGSVYPCQLLDGNEFVIGSIFKDKLEDILKGEKLLRIQDLGKSRIDKISKCSKCAFKHFCAGGCMAMALWEYGSIYYPEPICEIRRKILTKKLYDFTGNQV